MYSESCAIDIKNVSKAFPVYERPHHRLVQMLARRNKRRWYNEFVALRDVSFSVPHGETLGIVGRNGSGKSTLLQIICGTQTPTAGEVNVNGRVAALLELGSGFNPEFTGRENVYLNGIVLGLERKEIDDRFDLIASFAEIGDFMERPVRTYSSGMYVRLAFAVAINVSPDILIVDEALSVGDEAFQRKCFARINKIRESGATILFVSHSASTVVELCDRAILLDAGELLAIDTPKYVVSRYQKLLYSPADKVASIRDAIRNESNSNSAPTDAAITNLSDSEQDGQAGSVSRDVNESGERAYFEEGLVPKSTFRYEAAGASIQDPHIETLSGKRVNVLEAGVEYEYVYTTSFERAATNVRYGMLIKTITGLELAGSVTSWSGEGVPYVEAGTLVEVRFRFPCMFASGTYFLNAGVQGCIGEEEIYLDRWLDVAMFKVIHEPGKLGTTIIDLNIVPEISVHHTSMAHT
ncbi:ABC transporter ATP-binding protein [Dyella flava]|uniref:ABC transporter ATP-binding protein n=1 Tax=Dyella flava TaxID=1920170 RepID=A0ABS2K0M3_9GAMM|nr:ABC transporter ATP-binding protein [Dyella flava]MBM7124610.1 ABC transporter ATP-binding protein [Dyella flava]GLQ49263.1 ABC transporter [Dyella flava]